MRGKENSIYRIGFHMFLQSYVVPVCLFEESRDQINIRELQGSAFFINNTGAFLSARHVMEGAEAAAEKKNLKVGLVVKLDEGKSQKSGIAPISFREFAPKPFDIVIGQAPYRCNTLLRLSNMNIEVWKDIGTFGYPINAVGGDPTSMRLNLRCHKGYIQRLTLPEDLPFGPHPPGFELSFVLSKGLSGAPLFVHENETDSVIGVCVGTIRSEIIEDQIEEIDSSGQKYRESRLKIDEYGLAQDIRPLLGWLPDAFGGKSLAEISST
jgi:hypothetical protein